jgi:hypothetical protein
MAPSRNARNDAHIVSKIVIDPDHQIRESTKRANVKTESRVA